ncbi:alpha/beta fold hydrolase [Sinimarinibacterium sp. CAU 1509]|uniref:alpha/beta fold hydrolase n=1 Tax=Sinimarinibacterium sp. CAU 1509 TaxID=2562283 RepID=UPI0010AC8E4A|nr:alpha/beta fold hydrolase [Sinimarinibacterium sp. CAU 1509]TJY61102.1 alpha/beta fold hydrolase [Sinimarinibacterium sp. CAU 1509]
MTSLRQRALDAGLAANERVLAALDNAFDWVFLRESLVRSGQTPYECIYEGDPMSLRYYPVPEGSSMVAAGGERVPIIRQRKAVPLVLVPPLGVTTESFDLMPDRSLVRYMAARGYHTYLIDWGKPQKRHAHLSMADYASEMMSTALAEVRAHSGSKTVSLMGWCMGGLLCLIHLGLHGDAGVRNLITVASPIDLRGGGIVARAASVLNTPARLIRKFTSWRLHHLDPARLHAPAWLTTLGFKLTDPVGSISTYWDLLTRLWDREFVESHSTTADYLNNMLLYPGGVIQDLVVRMAVDNQLASGCIQIRDRTADLRKIKANLLVYAGTTDHLVPPEIARGSLDVVTSADKEFRIAPGGHMGVILGSKAQHEVWEPCVQWLASRSELTRARNPKRRSGAEETQRQIQQRRERDDPTL